MASYRKHKHPQVHVRLPSDLKDWLAIRAEKEGISLNSMFVKCIEGMKKIEGMV